MVAHVYDIRSSIGIGLQQVERSDNTDNTKAVCLAAGGHDTLIRFAKQMMRRLVATFAARDQPMEFLSLLTLALPTYLNDKASDGCGLLVDSPDSETYLMHARCCKPMGMLLWLHLFGIPQERREEAQYMLCAEAVQVLFALDTKAGADAATAASPSSEQPQQVDSLHILSRRLGTTFSTLLEQGGLDSTRNLLTQRVINELEVYI
jgi:hypothetical protein